MELVTSPCKTTHTTETSRGNHSGIQTRQGRRSLPPDDAEGGSMIDVDQSREEVFISKRRIFDAKSINKIGTWNVCTLYKCGSMAQVLREMKAYRLEVLGVSEMRWTGQGQFSSDGITVLYSGHSDQHIHEVKIFLSKGAASALIGWKPVSHRIITARLQTQQAKVTVIQVYAPTETAEDSEKDEFYSQVQYSLDEIPSYDTKLLIGDFNAQIGSDRRGQNVAVGLHGAAKETTKTVGD